MVVAVVVAAALAVPEGASEEAPVEMAAPGRRHFCTLPAVRLCQVVRRDSGQPNRCTKLGEQEQEACRCFGTQLVGRPSCPAGRGGTGHLRRCTRLAAAAVAAADAARLPALGAAGAAAAASARGAIAAAARGLRYSVLLW